MINVLFLMDHLTQGGAEKVLRTLVNNMDQSRFRITVQTINQYDPESLLIPGIRYKAINRCRTGLGKQVFSWWLRLCAEIGWVYPLYIRDQYDLEIAFLECGPTKFLSGSTNKQAVKLAWIHCDLKKRGTVPTRKLRRIYRSYDRVVCVSETVRDAFLDLFGDFPDSVVLHNVIDEAEIIRKAQSFSLPDQDLFTFLFVGRLSREKGVDRLLDACGTLKRQGYMFRLLLLGEGKERCFLEKQIEALELQKEVQLLGFRENPYPYIASADCIVCPSRYEGFSTAVAEALILGKPVIATPCSGMQELLGDSRYGILTDDSTESLCAHMKAILDHPEVQKKYAYMAAQRGRMFSKASAVAKTEAFFLDLIRDHI